MKTMKKAKSLLPVLVAGAALCLAGGCLVTDEPGYVGAGVEIAGDPPPVVVETPAPAPGMGFIWIGGAWAWNGGRWVWEAGRWEQPPHPGAVWVPHRYVYRNGRHVFVRGGWH